MFAAKNFFLTRPAGFLIIQQFTASGTWTAPTGVTSVDYLVVAGGAAGVAGIKLVAVVRVGFVQRLLQRVVAVL